MAAETIKQRKPQPKAEPDFLAEMTPNDALAILKALAKEDTAIAQRITQLAREFLSGVDSEDIADQVYFELENIEVEELWDRSGSTRYGYVDPTDMAMEMFEEALQPFRDELTKYLNLAMFSEATEYCLGLLEGIYKFATESVSEFKNWAVDIPEEFFHLIHNEWKKEQSNPDDIDVMEALIKEKRINW